MTPTELILSAVVMVESIAIIVMGYRDFEVVRRDHH